MNKFKLFLLALAGLFFGGFRRTFSTANVESNTGRHAGAYTKLADAAFSHRHLLVKVGTNADHVDLCGAANLPVGVCTDQPNAAEDVVNVQLLGASKGTVRMKAATALAAEIDVYAAASGFIQALPAIAGTYYKVGRTKEIPVIVASNVYEAEVEPCQPIKTVVVALVPSVDTLTDSTSGAVTTTLKAVRTDTTAHCAADAADNFAVLNAELVKVKTDLTNLAAAHAAGAGQGVVLAS